jgi:hypothetical protein
MSLIPLKKEFIEMAIKQRLKAILVEVPKYRCLVGIPGGAENKSRKYTDLITTYNRAKRNVKKLGMDPKILRSVWLTLLARENQPDADIATYAAKQEFGSYSENIPPRPFLRTTFEGEKLKKIQDKAISLLRQCAKQNRNAKEYLEKLGLYCADQVRKNIKDGPWEENSLVTIAIKGSTKPLTDTNTMARAITSWVDKNTSQKATYNKRIGPW